MTEPDRRACAVDGAYALALFYTIGYLGMVGALMFFEIPENNREVLLGLIGIMSAAQLGIIKHYYDGSKIAETAQVANIGRAKAADAVIQDLAKSTGTPSGQPSDPINIAAVVTPTGSVDDRSAPSKGQSGKPARPVRSRRG